MSRHSIRVSIAVMGSMLLAVATAATVLAGTGPGPWP